MGVAATVAFSLACAGGATAARRADASGDGPGPRPARELRPGCYDWPGREFSQDNHARVRTFVKPGDRAIDFRLQGADGREHRLADALKDGPVLLLQGSATCPVFRERLPALTEIAERYAPKLTTLLVYNIEAHPLGDPGPYKGRLALQSASDRPQSRSFEDRVQGLADLALSSAIVPLVDGLDRGEENPIWCTYGTCPACAFVIRPNGVLEAVHTWADPATLDTTIAGLLGR